MTDNELQLDNPLSEPIVNSTRVLYAPPADEGYWTSLEAKIMARLASTPPVRWWQVMSEWAQGGLVAAAAVLVILSLLLVQANREDVRTAYGAIMQNDPTESLPLPSGVLSEWNGSSTEIRGATFRDVISR